MQYKTIHDAPIPQLQPGEMEIWYMRPEWFAKGITGDVPNSANLEATHILLGKVASDNPEHIWATMQGEYWSPTGEANTLIQEKGLGHTSMSVGDCIRTPNGKVHLVRMAGFEEL